MTAVLYNVEDGDMGDVEGACDGNINLIRVSGTPGDPYPVNKLRNRGLLSLKTTHYIMVDVDFMPSQSLAGSLEGALGRGRDDWGLDEYKNTLLVVPAFERVDDPCKDKEECKIR